MVSKTVKDIYGTFGRLLRQLTDYPMILHSVKLQANTKGITPNEHKSSPRYERLSNRFRSSLYSYYDYPMKVLWIRGGADTRNICVTRLRIVWGSMSSTERRQAELRSYRENVRQSSPYVWLSGNEVWEQPINCDIWLGETTKRGFTEMSWYINCTY